MPLVLELEHLSPSDIRFVYSPFHEMLLSLHTLHDFRHHALHISWAVNMRRQLTSTDHDALRVFGFFFDRLLGLSWSALYHDQMDSFDATFARLEAMSVAEFTEVFATALAMHATVNDGTIQPKWNVDDFAANASLVVQAREWLQQRYPASTPMLTWLLNDPEQLRQHLTRLLASFWAHHFESEWHNLEALFQRDISNRGRILFESGLAAMFPSLGREFVKRNDKTVAMIRQSTPDDNTIAYAPGDEVVLFPSYFLWPHVVFSHSEDIPCSSMIVYAIPDVVRAGRPPVTPDELVSGLQAMANHTRLQILKLLRDKPRANKELATILSLSEPAVSKHVKELQRAGWLVSERESYYVRYRVDLAQLDVLRDALHQYLYDNS